VRVKVNPAPPPCWLLPLPSLAPPPQGQPALRHHVPEAPQLRPQGAGEEESGERPPQQR